MLIENIKWIGEMFRHQIRAFNFFLGIIEKIETSIHCFECLSLVSMRLLHRTQFTTCFAIYKSHELELFSSPFLLVFYFQAPY